MDQNSRKAIRWPSLRARQIAIKAAQLWWHCFVWEEEAVFTPAPPRLQKDLRLHRADVHGGAAASEILRSC